MPTQKQFSLFYFFKTVRKFRIDLYFLFYELFQLLKEGLLYIRTGRTTPTSFECLRRLYCISHGKVHQALHSLIRLFRGHYIIPNEPGLLTKSLSGDSLQLLKENGYYIFPTLLSASKCEALYQFALTAPCFLLPVRPNDPPKLFFDPKKPQRELYSIETSTLLENPHVQELITDSTLLSFVQSYLGCKPTLFTAEMLWSTKFSKEASSEAAQLYHLDMDGVKWIKFFIYLTDVSTEDGPHNFVAGSHLPKNQPRDFLKRGLVRIPDKDMVNYYTKEKLIQFTGKKGTMFAVDTRGFHKGTPIRSKERLVIQFQFGTTLFATSLNPVSLHLTKDSRLFHAMEKFPGLFKVLKTSA